MTMFRTMYDAIKDARTRTGRDVAIMSRGKAGKAVVELDAERNVTILNTFSRWTDNGAVIDFIDALQPAYDDYDDYVGAQEHEFEHASPAYLAGRL